MFKIGDKVVYGQTGVCEICDICEKEIIKFKKNKYYLLRPVFENNNIIYAPVDSDKIFMRHIITKEQAEELILKIPEIKEQIGNDGFSSEDFKNEILSHTCDDLVRLTAAIYEKKKIAHENKKRLGFVDEKFMRIGENLLFGELAAALDIPYEEVLEYIKQKLK